MRGVRPRYSHRRRVHRPNKPKTTHALRLAAVEPTPGRSEASARSSSGRAHRRSRHTLPGRRTRRNRRAFTVQPSRVLGRRSNQPSLWQARALPRTRRPLAMRARLRWIQAPPSVAASRPKCSRARRPHHAGPSEKSTFRGQHRCRACRLSSGTGASVRVSSTHRAAGLCALEAHSGGHSWQQRARRGLTTRSTGPATASAISLVRGT
jgi:hypothetical protein